jgi:hypothetical protein
MRSLINVSTDQQINFRRWHDYFNLLAYNRTTMNNFLRALIAGYGAKKLGGGCFGTIIVFLILYWVLGYANC